MAGFGYDLVPIVPGNGDADAVNTAINENQDEAINQWRATLADAAMNGCGGLDMDEASHLSSLFIMNENGILEPINKEMLDYNVRDVIQASAEGRLFVKPTDAQHLKQIVTYLGSDNLPTLGITEGLNEIPKLRPEPPEPLHWWQQVFFFIFFMDLIHHSAEQKLYDQLCARDAVLSSEEATAAFNQALNTANPLEKVENPEQNQLQQNQLQQNQLQQNQLQQNQVQQGQPKEPMLSPEERAELVRVGRERVEKLIEEGRVARQKLIDKINEDHAINKFNWEFEPNERIYSSLLRPAILGQHLENMQRLSQYLGEQDGTQRMDAVYEKFGKDENLGKDVKGLLAYSADISEFIGGFKQEKQIEWANSDRLFSDFSSICVYKTKDAIMLPGVERPIIKLRAMFDSGWQPKADELQEALTQVQAKLGKATGGELHLSADHEKISALGADDPAAKGYQEAQQAWQKGMEARQQLLAALKGNQNLDAAAMQQQIGWILLGQQMENMEALHRAAQLSNNTGEINGVYATFGANPGSLAEAAATLGNNQQVAALVGDPEALKSFLCNDKQIQSLSNELSIKAEGKANEGEGKEGLGNEKSMGEEGKNQEVVVAPV